MYAIASISPVEQFIVYANVTLAQRPESRIDLNELRILSVDALPAVQQKIYNQKDELHSAIQMNWERWNEWTSRQYQNSQGKEWYELNLQNVTCCSK